MSEIQKGPHFIKLSSKRCNTYLLQNDKYNVMIDSGSLRDRDELLLSFQKHNIRNIDALILTHAHFDHAQNAALIRETTGAKVLIHNSEKKYLEAGDCPLPQGTIPVLRYVMKHHAWRSQHLFRYEACKVDITFEKIFDLNVLALKDICCILPAIPKALAVSSSTIRQLLWAMP